MCHLSIVSPVYRAENLVHELVDEIVKNVEKITDSYEIILVEDGSPDASWEKIMEVCSQYPKVKGLKLSRNFGQHYAITAGLENSNGEWVVVMDCDLQDVPDEIQNLYAKAIEGYDLVFAQRQERKDKFLKRMSSAIFYRIFNYMTDLRQDNTIGNFGIYNRKVINAILKMQDHIRFFPTMSNWVGFKRTYLPVMHSKRMEGKTTYTWSKLFELAFNNMIAFSDKPLRLSIRVGIAMSLFSIAIGFFYLYKYYKHQIDVPGYASLIVSIWLLSGLIILNLGIVGIYIGKTFERVKDRPVYIVDQKLNMND
jgi:polyisoprenyl-phosphate glycosyltransferase